MSKYIDAEKLCDGCVSNDPVVIAAKCAPEEDVAPVIHAHWIKVEKYPPFCKCSNCNVWVKPQSFFIQIFGYCPNCGAKMDE